MVAKLQGRLVALVVAAVMDTIWHVLAVYVSCTAGDLCCNPLTLRNNAASSLGERDLGLHTDSDDDLDDMQLQSA